MNLTTIGISFAAIITSTLLAGPNDVWLNEFMYDDPKTDDQEMIELAIGDNVDPCSVGIYLYNGANGMVYGTFSPGLEFTVGTASHGMTMYWMALPPNSIQNGGPDGMAITVGVHVEQFLSYEGTFTAIDGPAAGMTSEDIGVSQTGSTGSLGLTGSGTFYGDFTWQAFASSTPGQTNSGQIIFNVTHNITATGISFIPDLVNVHRGDTVVWQLENGAHTVTEGNNCSYNGGFNALLTSSSPTFVWVVPANAPSTVDYFCIPHCPWMVGVLNVLDDPVICLSDLDEDGQVGVTDILLLISEWGAINPMYDLDCDGSIGVGDILVIINEWGSC